MAEGAPRTLMQEFDAHVVEVGTEALRAARTVLDAIPSLLSVAQLGTQLRVLLDPAEDDPEGRVRRALFGAGLRASVELTQASLEDVFVVATRKRAA